MNMLTMSQVRCPGLPGGFHECSSQADHAQLPGQSSAALCGAAVPCSTIKHRLCPLYIINAEGQAGSAVLPWLHRLASLT